MTTNVNGRVLAKAENGVPIFSDNNALFTGYYKLMNGANMPMPMGKAIPGGTAVGYGTTGAHNTIFGQFVSAVVFACDNAFTAIGVRPWDKTGIRAMTKLAQKGGISAKRGGQIKNMKVPDFKEVAEPYKELPYMFGFDIGLQMLESKDDTITWQNYIELQGKTYSDSIDYDFLRPLSEAPAAEDNEEVQVEKLSRIVSSFSDVGRTYGGRTLVASDIQPYGGTTSDIDRGTAKSGFDSYVNAKAAGSQLALNDLDVAWSAVAKYWANSASPQNKMWLMSFERQREIGALLQSGQRFLESVFTTRDINGVSTVPGRDAGFVTKAYNDIPIIADGNINVGADQLFADTPESGPIYLLDLDHIWYKALRPVDFRTTDQYQIYGELNNRATYFMEGEVCSDMWACHARIDNLSA